MEQIRKEIKESIVCPHCHGPLEHRASDLFCATCSTHYALQDGKAYFLPSKPEKSIDSEFQADRMYERTLGAKVHNLGKRFINSDYTPVDHLSQFIENVGPDERVVELGSGNRRLRQDIITLDLFPFPHVDIVANVVRTPFGTDSIDHVVLDTVLEHVPEPHGVIEEVNRILAPGGRVICIAPWIFPYHGYPNNYFNISRDGLHYLFRDFSECRIEMHMGPTSALTNFVSEYFAILFSRKKNMVYSLVKGLTLLPLFWLKYFDKYWYPHDKAKRLAAILCVVAKK